MMMTMEFGTEKCVMHVMKSGKWHLMDRMELPNEDKIRTLARRNGNLQILGHLGSWHHQTSGDERKNYRRRTRKLPETKLWSRNLIKRINTTAVTLVRYLEPFLKWTREELKQMDQRTRKLMTIHSALHPRDDIDRLYVSRKVVGRGLASIKDSIDALIQQLKDYIEKHGEGWITATRNDTDDTKTSRMTITRKQKWKEKHLHGHFKWIISNISHEKTWTWLRKRNLKRETKSLLIANTKQRYKNQSYQSENR